MCGAGDRLSGVKAHARTDLDLELQGRSHLPCGPGPHLGWPCRGQSAQTQRARAREEKPSERGPVHRDRQPRTGASGREAGGHCGAMPEEGGPDE